MGVNTQEAQFRFVIFWIFSVKIKNIYSLNQLHF